MTPDQMLVIAGIDPNGAGPCVTKLREVFAKKCRTGLDGYRVSTDASVSASDEALAYELLQWEWSLARGHSYPWVENPKWWYLLYWARKMIAHFRTWLDRNKKPFGVERP